MVSEEKPAVNLIEDHLSAMSCFSLTAFKICSLSFDSLTVICLGMDHFVFILFRISGFLNV